MSTVFYESVVVFRARSLLKNVNLPPRMSWITAKTAAWQHHLARIMNRQATWDMNAQGGPVWAVASPRDLSAYCAMELRILLSGSSRSNETDELNLSFRLANGKQEIARLRGANGVVGELMLYRYYKREGQETLRSVINYLDCFSRKKR